MNKKYALILTLAIGTFANAQPGEVTNAVLYHKDGNLLKAKESIDKATVNEKTSTKSKTWYQSGLIYFDLAQKQVDPTQKHSYMESAMNHFYKAIELNEGETWTTQSKDKLNELYATAFNTGIEFHNANDPASALKFDELASKVTTASNESRVNALINASIASGQLNMTDKSIELNKKILELKPDDADAYIELINLYEKKEDIATASKYADDGSAKFPQDKRFSNEVARLAIKSGKSDEAIAKLNEAVKKEPNNVLYLVLLADLLDKNNKKDEAVDYYKKALSVDPNHLDANYNLGSIYFNRAADLRKEYDKMDLNAPAAKKKDMENRIKINFESAISHYEKIYDKLSEADRQELKPTLSKAYYLVGREADADKLK